MPRSSEHGRHPPHLRSLPALSATARATRSWPTTRLWLDSSRYIPFLRDVGRHFSVNRMLSFDSVKLRLEREQPLSFLEFNYMVLQAYDFLELARRHDCARADGRLRSMGQHRLRRRARPPHRRSRALRRHLAADHHRFRREDGQDRGKARYGSMPSALSAYDYWQFWRNTEDADVGRFLKLFTELPLNEIARLEKLQGSEINDAKIVLANEATTLCHGGDAAAAAAETARRVFAEGGIGEDLPVIDVPRAQLEARPARDQPLSPGGPRRERRRSAPPLPRQRRAHQRSAGERREEMLDDRRSQRRRRDQALRRPQAPRVDQGHLAAGETGHVSARYGMRKPHWRRSCRRRF